MLHILMHHGSDCATLSPKVMDKTRFPLSQSTPRLYQRVAARRGAVRGLATTPDGDSCVSCGADSTVKFWKLPLAPFQAGPLEEESRPVLEFQGSGAFRGLDHHGEKDVFVTCGAAVDVWAHERTQPIKTFAWGSDSVVSVRFNPVSEELLLFTFYTFGFLYSLIWLVCAVAAVVGKGCDPSHCLLRSILFLMERAVSYKMPQVSWNWKLEDLYQ